MNYKGMEEKYLKLNEEHTALKSELGLVDAKLSEALFKLDDKIAEIDGKIGNIHMMLSSQVVPEPVIVEDKSASFIPLGQGLASLAMVGAVFTAKYLFDANWIALTAVIVVFFGLIETIGDRK